MRLPKTRESKKEILKKKFRKPLSIGIFLLTAATFLVCQTILIALVILIAVPLSPLILMIALWEKRRPLFQWWEKRTREGYTILMQQFLRKKSDAKSSL